ncbi:hypothetical protein LAV75_23070, partial [Shigella flexneri]|nr:hypothetical protein [Shigella flexneri]
MQMFRVYATSALINAVVEAFCEQLPALMQRDCPFKDLISQSKGHALCTALNRPGFPGECFICELRLPDHRFRWK